MANQQETTNFYGGVVKRIIAVYPQSEVYKPNFERLVFIRERFNSTRNYREFSGKYPVEVIETSSQKLPNINRLGKEDACLLVGSGRYLDKRQFEFAKKCFLHGIPIFYLRENSTDYDIRATNPIWRTNSIIVNLDNNKKCYLAPKKYFMQIPSAGDFIFSGWSNDRYVLLPTMVPTN